MKKAAGKFDRSRFHRAMQKAHLTAETLEQRLKVNGRGITGRVISRFMSGRQLPNKEQLCRLADALETDANELFIDADKSRRTDDVSKR